MSNRHYYKYVTRQELLKGFLSKLVSNYTTIHLIRNDLNGAIKWLKNNHPI